MQELKLFNSCHYTVKYREWHSYPDFTIAYYALRNMNIMSNIHNIQTVAVCHDIANTITHRVLTTHLFLFYNLLQIVLIHKFILMGTHLSYFRTHLSYFLSLNIHHYWYYKA